MLANVTKFKVNSNNNRRKAYYAFIAVSIRKFITKLKLKCTNSRQKKNKKKR